MIVEHTPPNLILGRGPCPRPTIEAFCALPAIMVEGYFEWELIRNGIIIATGGAPAHNLIVNSGLDAMATLTIGNTCQYIAVGTGSTAPANAQTALVAEVARTNRRSTGDSAITSGPAFAYWSYKFVYLFLETEANGNLTEVGPFNQLVAGTMFARQLFKDVGGVPTTIIKTAADQLRITYEVRCYSPTVDTTQTGLIISGTAYDVTTRAREIDAALVWGAAAGFGAGMLNGPASGFGTPGGRAFDASTGLGSTSTGLSGTSAGASTSTIGGYTNGNYYRDVTMKWEPPDGNLAGGIGGFHTYGGGTTETFQSLFTPVFAKDATKRLTLVSRQSWARYP